MNRIEMMRKIMELAQEAQENDAYDFEAYVQPNGIPSKLKVHVNFNMREFTKNVNGGTATYPDVYEIAVIYPDTNQDITEAIPGEQMDNIKKMANEIAWERIRAAQKRPA